ncbi:hypothetical protein KI688_007682 [Linnemannia hyalina]|uniref:Galactose oxidase n=1 Tax=Linnemannia hyalina TaxID=64524 RepID=A0A9P7XIE4_9FUNG|nr:hypothetical protein KI688_007682 [Linnemannia hyalina]
MLVFHLPNSNAVYEFRVETGTWVQSSLAFANMKWQGVGAVTDPRTGLVYLATGYTDPGRLTMDILNPATQNITHSKLPDPFGPAGTVRFEARWFYGGVWCASRKSILYWGGYQPTGQMPTENVVTELTVDTMIWSNLLSLANNLGEDGSRMVVFGGRVNNVPNNEVFVLNTATGAWTQGPSADARMYPACTIVGDLLLIWGGTNSANSVANGDMLIYNYVNSTWLISYTPPTSYSGLVPPKIPTTAGPWTTPSSTSAPSSTSSSASKPDFPSGSLYGTNTPSNNKESSTDLGAIVGGVVGSLAVISAAVGLLVYRRKQQQRLTQKGVPLLSLKTTHSDNHSAHDNNNHNNDDDDEEQDNAKMYAAGFGPVQTISLMHKHNLAAGGGESDFNSVIDTPKKGPQAIVQTGNSAIDMRMRDLQIQQQQLDLKWQLLVLQQQEQQFWSPLQQQQYQQQQQQLQLQQQLQMQQHQQLQQQALQYQQQQRSSQQQIPQLGGQGHRGSVVSVSTISTNTNTLTSAYSRPTQATSNSNTGSIGPYARQEYDDISSNYARTAPTVHTFPDAGILHRAYSTLDLEPKQIPNNPHTDVPH